MLWYATREQVKASLEIAHTARANQLIDSKLGAASLAIEGFLRGRYYPHRRTVLMDWPNYQYALPWQLWLTDRLISIEEVTVGDTNITADVIPRRADDRQEPPYTYLEVNRSSGAVFTSGTTSQQSISITGVFADAYTRTVVGAELGATISSSATSIVLNPTDGHYSVGVGSLVTLGTEYLILTNRSMSDVGQNLGGNLTANQNNQVVPVADGSAFGYGETILIDAERFRVDEIAGNSLIVTRAWDGSTLAAHTTGADIYAERTFTALRGELGTTAAAHDAGDTAYVQDYGLINELCIAEAVVLLEQSRAGYARVVGSGVAQRESAGEGLADIRDRAWRTYARKSRLGAI